MDSEVTELIEFFKKAIGFMVFVTSEDHRKLKNIEYYKEKDHPKLHYPSTATVEIFQFFSLCKTSFPPILSDLIRASPAGLEEMLRHVKPYGAWKWDGRMSYKKSFV